MDHGWLAHGVIESNYTCEDGDEDDVERSQDNDWTK
jgi:hypothetical protein